MGPDDPAGLCPKCLMQGIFDSSLGAHEAETQTIDIVAATDDDFGRYHILRTLGEGGMGTVYLAEQSEPIRRSVALKVVKLGMDTGEVLARFNHERQALALMDHPNIARIFDAGTTAKGRPYFVMEYIKGVAITQYCDNKWMTVGQRLELFLSVCRAVQHAHQKGVVHRDLKPSNVLVMEREGGPVPKVIDFGIAKATDQWAVENTLLTQFGQMVGTPEYASPEQAEVMTGDVNECADVYSLGVLLYELLIGSVPFDASRLRQARFSEMLRIIREEEAPSLTRKLNAMGREVDEIASHRQTDPTSLRRLVAGDLNWITMKALEKVRERRYASAGELVADLQRYIEHRPVLACPPSRLYRARKFVRRHRPAVFGSAAGLMFAFLGAMLFAVALATYLYVRATRTAPESQQKWEQLTFFTDAAVYPALSPDGRLLAFIRGNNTFLVVGDVYVKMLPSGEPVQLTHDKLVKLSPAFSPDGTRIVYGTVYPWDTWEVPALGGEARLMLRNASSLTWIEGGKRLLFSEIKSGMHMGVVTTDESRGQSRDVYLPVGDRSMVHHSYLSPDGKWVLVASQMDETGELVQCRVVPFDGSGKEQLVGPRGATCTAGAWSPDGKRIYLSTNQGGRFHIWRQRFPGGEPEQVTSGLTEEEGIAMARDGRSFLTSVGTQYWTIWIHDAKGEHQMSSEGDAFSTTFSMDGTKLFYLKRAGPNDVAELWSTELKSGKTDRVIPGYGIDATLPDYYASYAVTKDGNQVAFVKRDEKGVPHIWIASTDHRTSPQQLPSVENEDEPMFLPNGNLIYRASEGTTLYIYTRQRDGSGRKKLLKRAILNLISVSPDGKWIIVEQKDDADKDHPYRALAYPNGEGTPVAVCAACFVAWSLDGKYMTLQFKPTPNSPSGTYLLPVSGEDELPQLPPEGLSRPEDLKKSNRTMILSIGVDSALGPEKYSYTETNIRRNIYRVPIS